MKIRINYVSEKENGNIQQLPYDKFLSSGPHSLSDEELLAIILRTGTRGEDAVTLACRVLDICGESRGIVGLHHVTIDQLKQISGIGEVKAVKLKAIAELSTRIANAKVKRHFFPQSGRCGICLYGADETFGTGTMYCCLYGQ